MFDIRIDCTLHRLSIEVVHAEAFDRALHDVPDFNRRAIELRNSAAIVECVNSAFACSTQHTDRPTRYEPTTGWALKGSYESAVQTWTGQPTVFYLVQDPFGQNHFAAFCVPMDLVEQLLKIGFVHIPAHTFRKSPCLRIEDEVWFWNRAQARLDGLGRLIFAVSRRIERVREWRGRTIWSLSASPKP